MREVFRCSSIECCWGRRAAWRRSQAGLAVPSEPSWPDTRTPESFQSCDCLTPFAARWRQRALPIAPIVMRDGYEPGANSTACSSDDVIEFGLDVVWFGVVRRRVQRPSIRSRMIFRSSSMSTLGVFDLALAKAKANTPEPSKTPRLRKNHLPPPAFPP
jgi:hypothetical protein